MERWTFKIRMNQQLSHKYDKESGITQDSKLSLTRFSLLRNTIKEFIGEEIFTSLSVDDTQAAYTHESFELLEYILQERMDRIKNWATENG